jgi:hypothetical protein
VPKPKGSVNTKELVTTPSKETFIGIASDAAGKRRTRVGKRISAGADLRRAVARVMAVLQEGAPNGRPTP